MQQKEVIRFGSVQDISAVNSQGMFHYPSHWHDAAEFVLALKDGCRYRLGEEEYLLSRGDLLLIWPRELHEMVSVPENGTLFIQFSAGLLENNRDLSAALHMTTLPRLLSRKEHPELVKKLTDLMKEIMSLYDSGDFFRETRCKLSVYRMLLVLSESLFSAKIRKLESSSFSPESWNRVQQACDYINNNYTEDLRQTRVAAAVGLSSCYFSRLFRQYMQISFPDYLSRVRVNAATRLLLRTDLTVTECAYQAGFQSITVFNRVFPQFTGHTPREYRRLFLGSLNGPGTEEEAAAPKERLP